jgi:hypothetical protein
VLFSLLYLIIRGLFRHVPSAGEAREREVEILVLRHEVKVLARKAGASEAPAPGQGSSVRGGQDASTGAPVVVRGLARDAPPLAPGARQTQVDL